MAWTFLTNHGQVLLAIARDPGARIRDIADAVGITDRAAQRIVADLIAGGYVEARRVGRRNEYRINRSAPMRHPLARDRTVGQILAVLVEEPRAEGSPPASEPTSALASGSRDQGRLTTSGSES